VDMRRVVVTVGLLTWLTGALAQGLPVVRVMQHQEPRLEVLRGLVAEFEEVMAERGTPVRVEIVEGVDTDREYETQLFTQLRAGAAPDVFEVRAVRIPDLVAAGFLLDMTDRVETWDDWHDAFYDVIKEQAAAFAGDRVYIIPWNATAMSLFYRRDLLEEHGISTEPPQSWDDLLDRAREIQELTDSYAMLFPAGLTWGGGTYEEGFRLLLLGSSTPYLFDDEGRVLVRSPGLLETFEFYETAVTEGLMPIDPLLSPQPWVIPKYQMFPAGDLAITTSGTWAWRFDWGPEGQAPIDDLFERVDTWPLPVRDGGTFTLATVNWAWAISAQTPEAELAWELVQFLASDEATGDYAARLGAVSSRSDTKDVHDEYAQLTHLVEMEEVLAEGRYIIPMEGIGAVIDAIGRATEGILTGRLDARAALEEYAETVTNLVGADNVVEIPLD
jgi:multiple sugar transport system substrate-binding protein